MPAAVVSFGQKVSVRRRGTVSLPCVVVGVPTPRRAWARTDGAPAVGDTVSVAPDGTLRISDAQRQHSANYTCTASNANGSDQITHQVQVQGKWQTGRGAAGDGQTCVLTCFATKPSFSAFFAVAPGAPSVRVSSTSSSSVQLQWSVADSGGSAIRGYLLNFRREDGEWEERPLPADATTYRLDGLDCGSQYQLQVMAVNAVGSGPASTPLVARTSGSPPSQSPSHEFVETNVNGVGLRLGTWVENNCPIYGFSIQFREKGHEEWQTAASNALPPETFTLTGLWPGSTYQVGSKRRFACSHRHGLVVQALRGVLAVKAEC